MPKQTRLTDITIGHGRHNSHGSGCGHNNFGYRITGSNDTYTNNLQTSRVTDLAIHSCSHSGVNVCITGSPNVYINNLRAHRLGDLVNEFCGIGITITGSPDVNTN